MLNIRMSRTPIEVSPEWSSAACMHGGNRRKFGRGGVAEGVDRIESVESPDRVREYLDRHSCQTLLRKHCMFDL